MLLSHRIATSEKFLTLSPLDVRNRAELRGKILRATKIIVPTELMFVFSGRGVVGDLECIQQIIREAYGEHASTQEQQKKNNLFHEYSRLPFSVVFFENTTGGILAEELKDGYRLSMVTPQGEVSVYSIAYSLLLQQKDVLPLMKLDLHLRTTRHTPQEAILFEKLLMAFERLREDDQQSVSPASYLIGVLNACLFLNARNTVVHRYQLSRKEAGVIPKSLLPHFTYRVLDVFRERQAYENVKELEDFLQTTKTDVIKRRVHLVRGHFKNTKHGVFWWNAFTRCRKNEATVGVVQKTIDCAPNFPPPFRKLLMQAPLQTFFIRYFWLPLVRFVLDVKFLPNQLRTVYLRWRYGGPENYPPHIQPSARELQAVERLINLTSSANALRKVFGLREEDCVVFHALHLQLNTKLDDVDLATKFNSVMYSETPKREMYAIMQELEDIKPHQITYRFSDPAERAKFEAWLDTSVWQRYETFTAPQSDCDHDPR